MFDAISIWEEITIAEAQHRVTEHLKTQAMKNFMKWYL